MNIVDDKSDELYEQFNEMCYDLNMDKLTAREAWKSYRQVKQNYSLEVSIKYFISKVVYKSIRPLKS